MKKYIRKVCTFFHNMDGEKMKIKKVRKQLHKTIDRYGLCHERCIEEGKKFDQLAISKMKQCYKREEKKHLDKALDALLFVTIQLEIFPSVTIWNHYAKENDTLSSITLEYMTGKNWNQLRTMTYKKIKQMFKKNE